MAAKHALLAALLVQTCSSIVVNVVKSSASELPIVAPALSTLKHSAMERSTDLHVVDVGSNTDAEPPTYEVDNAGLNPHTAPLWMLGVIVCIAGTLFTSLGLVLQKFSHEKNAKLGEAVVYYSQPWWILGFSVFFAGQIVGVVAMPMAPQAMLSCLGALSLVFNAIFAWAMLGEHLHRLELVGMMGIIAGAGLVVHMTPVEKGLDITTAGLPQIVGPLFRLAFLGVGAGLALMLVAFRLVVEYHSPQLISIFWALVSGVCSGYTVTLFKCTSYLIVASERTQPWSHWKCYMVLIVAVLLCVAQLHTVNIALHSGRAMSVVPTIFAFNLLAQIGIGEVAYMEMAGMRMSQAVGFGGGIALILVCVVAIVRMSGMKSGPSESEFEAKLEETFESKLADENGKPEGIVGRRSLSMPARTYSLDNLEDVMPVFGRTSSETWLDHDDFSASFQGRSRTYTVSITGSMGLA